MAREGGCVGQGGSTHVGARLPVCPWTLGTLQGQLSVRGVLYGRAPHPRPLPGARFWPAFRQICHFRARVLGVWRWNGEGWRVMEGLGGCLRIPLDL